MLKTRVMLAGGRVHVESAPSGQRDVGFLAPAFNHIRELLVSDYGVNDVSAIGSMKRLESIHIGNPPNPRVGSLPDGSPLREVIMNWSPSTSVLAALPRLEHLAISNATSEAVESIRATLSSLILDGPRITGLVRLPSVKDKLIIHKIKHLDLRDLVFACAPRRLQLEDIGSISGLQCIPVGVEELILNSIGSAEGSDLHGIPAKLIGIDGTGLLPELRAWNRADPADLRQRADLEQAVWDKLASSL